MTRIYTSESHFTPVDGADAVSSSYTPVNSRKKSRVNSKAANVLAAAGMLRSNEGDNPRKRPETPLPATIERSSALMYVQGRDVGGVGRSWMRDFTTSRG